MFQASVDLSSLSNQHSYEFNKIVAKFNNTKGREGHEIYELIAGPLIQDGSRLTYERSTIPFLKSKHLHNSRYKEHMQLCVSSDEAINLVAEMLAVNKSLTKLVIYVKGHAGFNHLMPIFKALSKHTHIRHFELRTGLKKSASDLDAYLVEMLEGNQTLCTVKLDDFECEHHDLLTNKKLADTYDMAERMMKEAIKDMKSGANLKGAHEHFEKLAEKAYPNIKSSLYLARAAILMQYMKSGKYQKLVQHVIKFRGAGPVDINLDGVKNTADFKNAVDALEKTSIKNLLELIISIHSHEKLEEKALHALRKNTKKPLLAGLLNFCYRTDKVPFDLSEKSNAEYLKDFDAGAKESLLYIRKRAEIIDDFLADSALASRDNVAECIDEQGVQLLSCKGVLGDTPLELALSENADINVLLLLLEKGAPLSDPTKLLNCTAHVGKLKLLIDHNPNAFKDAIPACIASADTNFKKIALLSSYLPSSKEKSAIPSKLLDSTNKVALRTALLSNEFINELNQVQTDGAYHFLSEALKPTSLLNAAISETTGWGVRKAGQTVYNFGAGLWNGATYNTDCSHTYQEIERKLETLKPSNEHDNKM